MTLQSDIDNVKARVVDLLALCLESLWRLLPDQCEGEHCPRTGLRGNENSVDGRLLCDDCSAFVMLNTLDQADMQASERELKGETN